MNETIFFDGLTFISTKKTFRKIRANSNKKNVLTNFKKI